MKNHTLRLLAGLLAAIALLFPSASQGTPLYWDTNGTASGFGSSFTGNWNGIATNWNSDITGGAGGTLTAATTSSDALSIVAGGATGVINLTGSQAAGSLDFANTANLVALQISNGGSLAVAGAIADTGAGNSRIDVINSTQANAASILTATSLATGAVNLNSTTGGAQYWTTGYNMTLITQFGIGAANNSNTFRQTGGTISIADSNYGLALATDFSANPTSGTSSYIMDGGTLAVYRIGVGNFNGNNSGIDRYAGTGVLEWNGGTIQQYATDGALNIQNGSAFQSYNGTGTKDMQLNTSKPVSIQLSQTGTHTFNADGASGQIIVSPSAQIVDKSGEAGTLTKTGLGTLVFTGGGSTAVNSWTGNTTVTAGKVMTDYSIIAGQAATVGTDSLSNAYSSASALVLNGGNYELKGRSSASAASVGSLTLTSGTYTQTVGSTAGMVVGQAVTNANLPTGSYIRRILSGTTVELNAMSTNTVTQTGNQTLNFGAASFANTQTVNNVALAQAGTATTITVTPATGTSTTLLTFGNVTGAGGFTKAGTGTLSLTGNLTYTGGTVVSAGTLNFAPTSGNSTLTGTITGSGAIIKSGNGTTIIANPTAGANTFVGSVVVNGGTLKNAGANAGGLFAASSFTVNNGGILDVGNLGIGWALYNNSITINSGGTVQGGLQGISALTMNGGTLQGTASSGQSFALNSDVTVGGSSASTIAGTAGGVSLSYNAAAGVSRTFTVADATGDAAADLVVSTPLVNSWNTGSSANLIKAGAGTMVLSAANTYNGTTAITMGTLQIGAGGSTGSLATGSAITNNGTLAFSRNNTITQGTNFASVIGGTGNVTQSGTGTLVLSGTNSYTGTTTITSGTLVISGGGSIGNGAVALNGGTLIVNGAVGNGGVTVGSGATMGGSGSITGAVIVSGTLAPGNSPGNITVANSVTLADGGALSMEINGATVGTGYDRLTMTGGGTLFSLNGTNDLILSLGYTPANNALFFLVDNQGGSAISGVFEKLNGTVTTLAQNSTFTVGLQSFKISYTGDVAGNSFLGGDDLVLQAVPEPAAWIMAALGLTVTVVFRRRRRE
ncbi:MAG: hypothetical protein D4R65_14855 [Verrucomicrobiaceae bacterium]|nr:MAG: hypothetical protein D4R65_14855 [Verrucomicrobiaceae bacterium]